MPKFQAPERAFCPKCKGAVYKAEERVAGGYKFHVQCFKCEMCSKKLDSTTVSEHEDKIFCKNCHGRKYGPKGYGFGGGAGALSMDTGGQFGNKDSEMSNKPTSHLVQGQESTGEDACGRCKKRVYGAESAIGAPRAWHKTCFNCADCHKSLDSTTLNNHEGEIYCKGCYGKNYGPKGFGFGVGGGALTNTGN